VEGEEFSLPSEGVDKNFFDAMNITISEGRNFSDQFIDVKIV